MRILCLDVGEKKIGVAVSDPTGSIAQAVRLLRRSSLADDIRELQTVIETYGISKIVLGLPKNLNGSLGKKAQEVMEFAKAIGPRIPVPITFWDERFSTNEAHRVFDLAQVTQKKRKPYLDMIASQLILQGYLDAQKVQ